MRSNLTADMQQFTEATEQPTWTFTSFRPGFHRNIQLSNGLSQYNGTTTKAFVTATALDLAIAAIQPEGLPITLLPLYKIVHGVVLKKGHYNIARITTKLVIISGAFLSAKIIFNYFKPTLIEKFISETKISMSHRLGHEVKEWLAINGSGSARRHLMLTSTATSSNHGTQNTNITRMETSLTSGRFWFEGLPIFFECCNEFTQRPASTSISFDEHENPVSQRLVSNESICLRTFGLSSDRIDRFLESVESDTDRYANTTKVWTLDAAQSNLYGPSVSPFKYKRHLNRPLT